MGMVVGAAGILMYSRLKELLDDRDPEKLMLKLKDQFDELEAEILDKRNSLARG